MDARHLAVVLEDAVANAVRGLINLRRQQVPPPDYVLIEVKGRLPERETAARAWRRWMPFRRRELSIEMFSRYLDLVAQDPDVKGVVLRLGEVGANLPRLQNVRAAITRFRQRGKRVIAYASTLDFPRYYVATAADELVFPESGTFAVTGLASQVVFIKDTLARLGIEADIEAIGEYKTAADPVRRSEMSEAHREMLNALLDSFYTDLLDAIATGRKADTARVQEWIDAAPLLPDEVLERGLADALCYEDELPTHLSQGHGRVTIKPWSEAWRSLRQKPVWHRPQAVGVVSLHGTIVPGESREVPLPVPLVGTQAGAESLARALRRAEKDPRIAAVVLHVDSGGGDALASDLIWREVKRLRERKPVVAYMGDVAASGGYYVLAAADHIVAQSATLTGSIGVIGGKFLARGLYEKLRANPEILHRGRHAVMNLPDDPYTEEERQKVLANMQAVYRLFKQRVAEGRQKSLEEVEEIARGRVWTGRQALEIGLVDELGDFQTAVERAKMLAGLPIDETVPVVPIEAPKRYLPPLAFTDGTLWLEAVLDALRPFLGTRILTLMPWTLRLVG